MHQGVPTQQGVSTRRTTQEEGSWSSRSRRGSSCRSLCPPSGAPLWAWLLLGALLVPGAWSFLNEEQEELLVELHNHYRGQVSPSASAMMPLKWDANLKVIAEGYAAKCIWNHNPDLMETGENLFAGTGPLDIREALEKWFLEHLDHDFQNNSCTEDKLCGHYTQMVWADTHRVGCAFHFCNNMEGLDWERVSYLVCNYYPPGNFEEERPYVEGEWCSRCPENLQKCENNLCVADSEEYEEEEEEEEEDGVDDEDEDDDEDDEDDEDDDDDDEDDEDEGGTVFLSQATSEPFLLPEDELDEEEEEEAAAASPVTSAPDELPDTTSTPSITTTSDWDSEKAQPTPAPGTTPPPGTPSTTPEEEEEEEEEVEQREEKAERDVTQDNYKHRRDMTSGSDSVSSPSLLLAFLIGILTLRL
ncbi:peptidase inhibitor 16-like [Pseudochaenichthys georgianus]|uniref:peptidase inhibitor 16-like n=1 Tax=Pseudochaenichthys georgianus TaxID=52239 RepID=UPI00146F0457|nr:peptidase inhibitor 16-like [Pseudochaenichthys georgianus]